jgi:hypothetical protein
MSYQVERQQLFQDSVAFLFCSYKRIVCSDSIEMSVDYQHIIIEIKWIVFQ